MKKLIFSIVLIASVAAHSAQGIGIFGEVFFSSVTAATLDGTPATATKVTFGTQAVDFGLGDYLGSAGSAVTQPAMFTFGALGTTGPNVVTPLWTYSFGVGPKIASFDLMSITLNALAGTQRNLEGLGIAKLTGFDDSLALWTMNFSGSSAIVSWSAATHSPPPPVPDSGTTLALLGICLLGLAGIARRFKK